MFLSQWKVMNVTNMQFKRLAEWQELEVCCICGRSGGILTRIGPRQWAHLDPCIADHRSGQPVLFGPGGRQAEAFQLVLPGMEELEVIG